MMIILSTLTSPDRFTACHGACSMAVSSAEWTDPTDVLNREQSALSFEYTTHLQFTKVLVSKIVKT